MAEEVRKVPLKPILAWEETRPPRRKSPRKSPQQQQELCVPQPFHADSPSPRNASCFMGPDSQEKETLDHINTFLKGNEQEEAKKLEFLDRVITISRAALTRHPEQNLAVFLCKALLVEKIKELIDLESVDSLTSGVRQQAMLAVMELSKVKPLLRGMELFSLLTVCFSSVFSLPPAETNQGVEAALYNNTLNTMDELLKALVCEDEKPNLVVLQNIVEGTMLPNQSAEYLQVLREWRAENTFWVTWFTNTSNIAMMFGKYFNPSEHMDFLLTAIEGMRDTSVHDSVAARHMLHVILWVPSPSLERVSEAVPSVYHNLDSISEPLAQQQLLKALVVLGDQCSEEVVTTLLGCSLSCDRRCCGDVEGADIPPQDRRKGPTVAARQAAGAAAAPASRHLSARGWRRPLGQPDTTVQVGKLQHLLPDFMEQLHEADRDVISNTITVLKNILAGMDRQSASPMAVRVAEKLLPFFHDEFSKLRVLSITLFKHLLELVRGPSRRKMKEHVLRSLVPLLLLLHDERPNVSQVACYKGRAETFLCQTMAFLKNPQAPIREEAIRFLGLTARQLDQQSQEKLEAICNVLKGLQQDTKSSIRCLALQTMLILNAFKKHRPARASLRTLLYRMRLMCTRESPVIEAAQLPE
ncbi:unnamed protein product [Lepidochelys olivacea]